jgi:sulfane dehydrogenase subunit SoxC
VTGLAWSGAGRIARVEVSADGGATWADAALDDPVLPKNFVRFRSAWRWDGQPATLLARAIDETGSVQPTRDAVLNGRGSGAFYHYNAIQAWRVGEHGEVRNVYL